MQIKVNAVIDITFSVPAPEGINPWFHKWKAVFTSSKGTTLSLPGFFDGGEKWVIRFSPTEEGEWTYLTYSEIPGLNGQKGAVQVGGYDDRGLSLAIDPEDPAKLVWSDGSPYYLMGFECDWLSLLDFDHEGIPRAANLIDAMEENGFNHVVMNVYARDTEWEFVQGRDTEFDYANPLQWPFGGSWEKPDYEKSILFSLRNSTRS